MTSKKSQVDAASRRRQLQKQQRKKLYEDIQIQGTNNSSIASKRSVEQIYTTKLNPELGEWFKHFVPKPKRRSPAINRGYWLRMEAIRLLVLEIMEQLKHKDIAIINLGCGFDPLPFQLLNMQKESGLPRKNMVFYDFDYPTLVERKKKMISESEDIKQLIGEQLPVTNDDCVLQTSNYRLIGCDLKDASRFASQLDKMLDSIPQTKIFVAEVSLAYVRAEFSNPVIEVASKLENSHMLILEQLLPLGPNHPFARKMLHHFDHLRSPIYCVETYPTEADQVTRFKKYFEQVELRDLWQVWNDVIKEELKAAVGQIEEFDEWEEFIMFCQHYFILHALTEDTTLYKNPRVLLEDNDSVKSPLLLTWETLKIEPDLQVKFPAVASFGEELIIHGGLDQTRSENAHLVNLKSGKLSTVTSLNSQVSARMCHQLISLSDKEVLLTGGRSRPGSTFRDVYKFSKDDNGMLVSTKLGDLASSRWRHASVGLLKNQILLFGGLEGDKEGIFEVYDVETERSANVKVEGQNVPNLLSCGMCYNADIRKGYIVGGIENNVTAQTNGAMYEFTINNLDKEEIIINVSQVVEKSPLLERIGCQLEFLGTDLLIVGGVNYNGLLTQDNSIVLVDTENYDLMAISISDSVWGRDAPIFIGFSMVKVRRDSENKHDPKSEQEFAIFGGGAVCYAFGSYCNSSMYYIRANRE